MTPTNSKFIAVCLLTIIAASCGGKDTGDKSERTDQRVESSVVAPIKNQKIAGLVRGTTFNLEQAIIETGTLTLRQGQDFFADASVEIVTFEQGSVEGKTYSSHESFGQFNPHILLGLMSEGKKVPDRLMLMDDYELILTFNKKDQLGIPFSIRLVSAKHNTSVEGYGFATFGDINVVDGKIDKQSDSLDTLIELAKQYAGEHHQDLELGESFGVSTSSYGGNNPNIGFVGFEAMSASGELETIKLQLIKDENGWRVARQLGADELPQAHPLVTDIKGSTRTIENKKAHELAGQELERRLREQGVIANVRSALINCQLTDKNDKASCKSNYTLKVDGESECHHTNFLLTKESGDWKFHSDIPEDKSVDQSTGALITKKILGFLCLQ